LLLLLLPPPLLLWLHREKQNNIEKYFSKTWKKYS